MRLYRLTPKASAADAFSGEGSRRFGGRWNLKGTPVVYASNSPALAALEALVHFKRATAPLHYLYTVEVPDGAITDLKPLPAGWDDEEFAPTGPSCIAGSLWAASQRSLALLVPSAVVQVDSYNVILNPLHPDFRSLKPSKPKRFTFDSRLVRHK